MNSKLSVDLLSKADTMAAAAASFSASHGYDAFLEAREAFKEALRVLMKTLT